MDCAIPPPLTEDQVSAAADGAAGPDVLDHLARCPACAARVAAARRFETALHGSLDYFDCPTPAQLGAYHLSMISAEDQRAIVRHLEVCGRCREELATLQVFMDEGVPAPPAVVAPAPARGPRRPRLGELVARLLPVSAVPAVRGVRSRTFSAEAGTTTIMLDVQPAAEGGVALQGQILDDDADRWSGALVELHAGGALETLAVADDLGGFRFAPTNSALVSLRLTPRHGPPIFWADVDLNAEA